MILSTRCLGERALDGSAIAGALEAVGLDRVLLSASEGRIARDLKGLRAVGVACPWSARRLGIAAARQAAAGSLVLAPDPDWDLERACRELFDLGRQVAGLPLALATPVSGALAGLGEVELVLEDLAAQQLGYWHHPARVHLVGGDDSAWLERLGRRLVGLSLDDVADGRAGLPPGLGELDLPRLAELTGAALEVTVDVDPVPDVALLRMTVDQLQGLGFA